jgi:hypothetical protein
MLFLFGSTGVGTQDLVLAGQVFSSTLAIPIALFALVIFWIGPHFYALMNLDWDPIYASCIAGLIGEHHHTSFLLVIA